MITNFRQIIRSYNYIAYTLELSLATDITHECMPHLAPRLLELGGSV